MREFTKIVIVGAGEQGRITQRILSYNKKYKILGFLDDIKTGDEILGTIKSVKSWIDKDKNISFFVAIGDNYVRREVYNKINKDGARFVNAIHPSAHVEEGISLGDNITIGAFSYINIGSSIGSNTIINNGCIVEHDNIIGQHCHLAPRVVTAGEVEIQDGAFVGIGCTIKDKTHIGKDCFIGAGSNIVSDTKPYSMYFGNPAKFIKKL
jgi:acetyltransferase EpsM